ncbi:hypothetical protein A9Q90_00630 [Gammaproteobacteria bacterium 54_18_T64]|nr:hypothetical protein A9Q90_00630 [Gammaproteobacteria bacterium 54_18_T64]
MAHSTDNKNKQAASLSLDLAFEQHQNGNLAAAEQSYRQLLSLEPGNPDISHYLGILMHQMGQHEKALALVKASIALAADRPIYHSNYGNIFRQLGQLDQAGACYRKSIALCDSDSQIHFNLAEVLQQQGLMAGALLSYRQALQLKPDYGQAHNNLGICLKNLGRHHDALSSYEAALAIDPRNLGTLFNAANVCSELERDGEAICHYRALLQVKPDHAEAHYQLARTLQRQGDYKRARSHYQDTLRIQDQHKGARHNLTHLGSEGHSGQTPPPTPRDAEAHNQAGLALQKQGRHHEALNCYQSALLIAPSHSEARNNLSQTYIELDELEAAFASCHQALNLDANCPEALSNMGRVLFQLGRHGEAHDHYDQALKLKPEDAQTHTALGNTLRELQRPDEAIEHYRAGLALAPHRGEIHFELATALRLMGRQSEARQHYQSAVDCEPNSAEAHYQLGLALGQGDAAIEHLQKALTIAPQHTDALANLGRSYAALGKLQPALDCYQKTLELQPDDAETLCVTATLLEQLGQLNGAAQRYSRAQFLALQQLESSELLAFTADKLEGIHDTIKNVATRGALEPLAADVLNNLGLARQELGQLDRADEHYRYAMRQSPQHTLSHWSVALLHLLRGEFAAGWREYEWGLRDDRHRSTRHYPLDEWRGGSLQGKTLLVCAEQGIGDEVMFASCIPDLLECNAKAILLECDPRLETLFQRSFPALSVRGKPALKVAPQDIGKMGVDCKIPIGSLPLVFRPDCQAFPRQRAFLKPCPVALQKWQQRYTALGPALKVGISWRGGIRPYDTSKRSAQLSEWRGLFQSRVDFINLQYGECEEEVRSVKEHDGVTIHDWDDADPLTQVDDLTAQLAALDLVISIGNTTAHFAGAVGTPTWVLLPFAPGWRWLAEGDTSPWYGSLRLFRQEQRGEWPQVFDELQENLASLIQQHNL